MNTKRAKEILDSNDMIQVLHDGASVWLEKVEGDYAKVKNLSTNIEEKIPVNELHEVH